MQNIRLTGVKFSSNSLVSVLASIRVESSVKFLSIMSSRIITNLKMVLQGNSLQCRDHEAFEVVLLHFQQLQEVEVVLKVEQEYLYLRTLIFLFPQKFLYFEVVMMSKDYLWFETKNKERTHCNYFPA